MLTCRLLGPVEVWFDDERIDLGFPRQRTLFAMLLVEANRLVTLDSLIDRIWAEHPPTRASHAVYADVSKLRRALTPASGLRLVRHTGGYLIEADPATIDLHCFRAFRSRAHSGDNDEDTAALLDEALALWRGDAFAGLDNPWLTTVRTSLNSEKLAAILDRNDAYLCLGRHTHLLTDLADMSTVHPLDERLAAQYMAALHHCGRPADALAHYHRTRGHLAEELGVDPGLALQELHEHILRNDPHLHTTTPPPAQPPIPRQLPAHAPHFVGRTEELRRLTALLDTTLDAGTDTTSDAGMGAGGTAVISAIGGAGGIGKTWLALHWAHRHANRFPDGQLFVDLQGFSPAAEPMSPPVAVRGFLDALGVAPGRIPPDSHAQAALFRSLVTDRRMLLVLDNAADATQVMPLLPGSPTCTVLITSRRQLTGVIARYGAHHLPVSVLSDADARQVLVLRLGPDRVAAEPAAVDDLLASCAGFPLALSIIASRAVLAPGVPLGELAAELRDATTRLGALNDADTAVSLPAVLSWSLRTLTDEQARVFGLLGIAPGPDISLTAAASLTGLPDAQTAAILRTLEQASLLDRDKTGRYQMHDLVRLHAREHAGRTQPEAERETAVRRVVDFYLHTANAGNRHLVSTQPPRRPAPPAVGCHPQPLTDDAEAMVWLHTEYRCLLACQQAASQRGWHDTVWHLAWALTPLSEHSRAPQGCYSCLAGRTGQRRPPRRSDDPNRGSPAT
jgi:DNA-binding SARP family transcriptional activator